MADELPTHPSGVKLDAGEAAIGGDVIGRDKILQVTNNYYDGQLASAQYTVMASTSTPGLIIFVIDTGSHAQRLVDQRPVLEVVKSAIDASLRELVFRSTKGSRVSDRYHVGCWTYGREILNLLDGIKPLSQVLQVGFPTLQVQPGESKVNLYRAFRVVEQILTQSIRTFENSPAPLICHVACGEYGGRDPGPVAARIREMGVADGNVLIENVLIDEGAWLIPVTQTDDWTGTRDPGELATAYARELYQMASPMPEQYQRYAHELGYNLGSKVRLLFPGTPPELMSLGFSLPAATAVGARR